MSQLITSALSFTVLSNNGRIYYSCLHWCPWDRLRDSAETQPIGPACLYTRAVCCYVGCDHSFWAAQFSENVELNTVY